MNVLILGLGQYPKGSGIAAALYFARRGDDVTVTDVKTEQELAANVKTLKKFKNVRFVLGRHDEEDVRKADLIVRNPRVSANSPGGKLLQLARKLGKAIESDISLFLERCPALVIGVTGTRGKSTTSTLLAEMFRSLVGLFGVLPLQYLNNHVVATTGRDWREPSSASPLTRRAVRKIWLGGNILVSPLTFLDQVTKNDIVVLELSSWQLEALGEKGISPPIAVWTNLMRDHLNTYSGMDEYAEAKAQIFRHQNEDGIVFLPADRSFNEFAKEAPGEVFRFGKPGSQEARIVKSVKMKLIGEHNRKNAEIATAVALRVGVPSASIKNVLREFTGLENRLELVATKKGIQFINDTTATTPDATIAALKSFAGKRIHLIFGGADKELEFGEVAKAIKRSSALVYLLPGSAHEKIISTFKQQRVSFDEAKNLSDAMKAILQKARKGDVVLLSPGCASFGLFNNEFDRGEQFKRLVAKIK